MFITLANLPNIMSEIYLLSYTRNIERMCAVAMRSCYSSKSADELYLDPSFTEEDIKRMLAKSNELGHLDVLEHGSLTFSITQVSRAFTHQMVRYRLASFSQQSQRHIRVKADRPWYVKPPSLTSQKYDELMNQIVKVYDELLLDASIKKEDARFVLPNATMTHLTMSANPRELKHIFAQRCDPAAQWEIRRVVWGVLALSYLIAPNIFASLDKPAGGITEVQDKLKSIKELVDSQRPTFNATECGKLFTLNIEDPELKLYALKN